MSAWGGSVHTPMSKLHAVIGNPLPPRTVILDTRGRKHYCPGQLSVAEAVMSITILWSRGSLLLRGSTVTKTTLRFFFQARFPEIRKVGLDGIIVKLLNTK